MYTSADTPHSVVEEKIPTNSSLECDERARAYRNPVDRPKTPALKTVIAAGAGVATILTVYLLRLDQVVGQFKDDGWYVVLAKSLATGQGYKLINLPDQGQYFYPPGFPFLLSLLYRILPEFPRNVPLLKSLSIVSMVVLSFVLFRLFDKAKRMPRSVVYLLALCSALAPSFVMLATSTLMSECLYAPIQFAALLFAERETRNEVDGTVRASVYATSILAALAYLTRTFGVALLAGIAVNFVLRKKYKELAIFVFVIVLFVGSWAGFKRFGISGNTTSVAAGYTDQFWDRLASSGEKVTVRELPGRFWQISTVLVGDDVGALLMPSLYRTGGESGEELTSMTAVVPAVSRNVLHEFGSTMGLSVAGQVISLMVSIVVFIGFVAAVKRDMGSMELAFGFSILMIVIWPWPPMRYLVPLFPFFIYYLVLGVKGIYGWLHYRLRPSWNENAWSVPRIVLMCILALFLYDHAGYLLARRAPANSPEHPDWLRRFDAGQQAAVWVRDHTPANEIVSGDNLPMLYLYSQRLTEKCGIEECVAKGIRYYAVQDKEFSIPPKTLFEAPYRNVKVVDLQNPGP